MKNMPVKLLILICLCTSILNAQKFQIEESVPFVEPEDGWIKMIILTNGNTALVHFTLEDGVKVRLYDPTRKLTYEKMVNPNYGNDGKIKKRGSDFQNMFSIGTDIVIFYRSVLDHTPVLYRLIIDSKNGTLVKEEEIGRLSKYGMEVGLDHPDQFFVRKDKNSDHYAVGLFRSNEQIELRHYNGRHEAINQGFYLSPNDEFKYMELVDFIVVGGEKVIACAYVYNKGKDEASYLSIARMEKGSKSIAVKQLDFTADMTITNGILRQVPGTDLVALLGLSRARSKGYTTYYAAFLSFLNTSTSAIEYTKTIENPGIRKAHEQIFGSGEDFTGIPQDFYVNEDGTYTLVFEELTTMTQKYTTTTILGSTGVTVLDKNAKELYSYVIPKMQIIYNADYKPMYLSYRDEGAQRLLEGQQYKSFAYVNSAKDKYIFFNDLSENLEKIKKGKLTKVTTISDTDGFSYALKDGKVERNWMFGESPNGGHAFAMFAVSDYDPVSGTYATVRLQNHKEKKMQVIWMRL